MNENNQPQSQCPKCGKGPIIMFTADDDICQACGKIITPERQPSHSPTEQPGDAKHTPGPWEINDFFNELNDFYEGQDITISKGDYPILTVSPVSRCLGDCGEGYYDEFLANAELIAKAPEMAAELEQLRSERDKRGKWISVDENPPAYTGQEYFRQAEGELIPIFVTDGKTSWIGNKSGDIYMFKALFPTVTHWMEIELPTSALSGGSKQ